MLMRSFLESFLLLYDLLEKCLRTIESVLVRLLYPQQLLGKWLTGLRRFPCYLTERLSGVVLCELTRCVTPLEFFTVDLRSLLIGGYKPIDAIGLITEVLGNVSPGELILI